MEHWVGVFPRDFAQREFLDRFNQICKFVGEINMVRYKALLVQRAGSIRSCLARMIIQVSPL